jgi:hypothetical protein
MNAMTRVNYLLPYYDDVRPVCPGNCPIPYEVYNRRRWYVCPHGPLHCPGCASFYDYACEVCRTLPRRGP